MHLNRNKSFIITETNSEQFVFSFQQGKEKGVACVFHSLYPLLTLYCFKITADKEASEEIASNAFIKIWQKHERFTEYHSIKAYLYRIVRNDAFKFLQKEKRHAVAGQEFGYLYSKQHEKDHFTSLVNAETTGQLLKAINGLPTECSKVLRLMFIEGRSIKETAKILHLSPSTIKTQKKRGVEVLRKKLYLTIMVISLLVTSCGSWLNTGFSGQDDSLCTCCCFWL